MQYFGAILVKSALDLIELENYYQNYRKDGLVLNIEKQNTTKINVIEHGDYTFNTKESLENCYIIYAWGSNKMGTLSLDIRGN